MSEAKKSRLGKMMIPFFIKAKLDPNGDGVTHTSSLTSPYLSQPLCQVMTKSEFCSRIGMLLNVDE